MANRCLYLHETIDIVGTGSEPYKAHTGRLGTHRTDGGAPLVGTWQQSGSTGTWPTVINLWEMRDWNHWAEILTGQYTRTSGQTPKLKRWWTKASALAWTGWASTTWSETCSRSSPLRVGPCTCPGVSRRSLEHDPDGEPAARHAAVAEARL